MVCHQHKYHLGQVVSCFLCRLPENGLCYTSRMAKETTLNEIGEMLAHVVKHMATKDDIADVRKEMATKDQILGLQTQVNSIEQQLRETRIEVRLGGLEEKVFCAVSR